MIYPTPRAVWLMMVGAPILLLIAIFAPALWVLAGPWMTFVCALLLWDAAISAQLKHLTIAIDPPPVLYMGSSDPVNVHLEFTSGPLPARMDVKLDVNAKLQRIPAQGLQGFSGRVRTHTFQLIPRQRGEGKLGTFWVRWTGPAGLIYKQLKVTLQTSIPITPNTRWVKEEAVRLYARDADFGIKMQLDRGDGSEFDALREFSSGMDRRAIDWKHSARHRQLLAKEFRTERNHNIIFAFDTGRLMSEPLGGQTKLDRAINAALLLAYVSLRAGDRTALYSFDARPGLASHTLSGRAAFAHMQHLAAQLDYSSNEANYTLALTDLASRLQRRSLIILFTDFVDTISTELMLDTIGRLTHRHVILFATFKDDALETMVNATPDTADDVSRAVIADALLDERKLVFKRLQRLGAHVIETTPETFGSELVSRYLEIKRKEIL